MRQSLSQSGELCGYLVGKTAAIGSFPDNGYGLYDMQETLWNGPGTEKKAEPTILISRKVQISKCRASSNCSQRKPLG